MDRKHGFVSKEEPEILWQDKHIAVLSKGPGWIVTISRELGQNKILSSLLRAGGTRGVQDLVQSGKCEHLCHYVSLKFKAEKSFALSSSNEHEFGLAHRLDVDTSGAIMIGKSEMGFSHLRQSFSSHQVFKEYICLVHGPVKKLNDSVCAPILWNESNNTSSISDQGMWAKSIYTVLGRYRLRGGKNVFTLCRVIIITGRTHQIRIHMAHIGHPLVGDSKYNRKHAQTDFMWCPRLFLHAWRLGFWDCGSTWHEVKAPLTRDLTRSLRTLEEIKLDLDNLDNPSCRVVGPPGQAKEVAQPSLNPVCEDPAPQRLQPAPPQQTVLAPPPPPLPPPPPSPPPLQKNATAATQLTYNTSYPPVKAACKKAPDLNGIMPHKDGGNWSQIREGSALPCPVRLLDGTTVGLPNNLPTPPPPPPKMPAHTAAALPAQEFSPEVAIKSTPATPTTQSSVGQGSNWPAPLPLKRDVSHGRKEATNERSQLSEKDRDQLEELCCDLAKNALLTSPEHQLSIALLGSKPEISSILQQLPSRRRKLSKILQKRPGKFVFLGAQSAESIVSLSQQALAFVQLEEASAATQHASNVQEPKALPVEPAVNDSKPAVASEGLIDRNGHEETCRMLVDMGFDRKQAMKALQANDGDMFEAMDHLSTLTAPVKGIANKSGKQDPSLKSHKNAVAQTEEAKPIVQPSEPNGPHDPDKASKMEAPDNDEHLLEQILALSHKEEEERKRRQQLDEEALTVALASSLLGSADTLDANEEAEDEQLKEALEQSKRMEEDRKRQEQREMEDIEQAEQESMRNYERFHQLGDDAFEETLRQSFLDAEFQDVQLSNEEEILRQAIQASYNQASNAAVDDRTVYLGQQRATSGGSERACITSDVVPKGTNLPQSLAMDESGCDSSPTCTPSSCTNVLEGAQTGTTTDILACGSACLVDDTDGQHATNEIQPDGFSLHQGPSDLSIRDWLFRRMSELRVEFDCEVLWMALNQIEADQLHDEDVLKMWLGFSEEEKLSAPILSLLSEFRQRSGLQRCCMNQRAP